MPKYFSLIAVIFVSSLAVAPAAFAISGECLYHAGVNCGAGPNAQGYAVCNDGWASSVLYSQTDECQPSCYTPDQIAQMDQFLQSNANNQIQNLENLEQSEIADQQSTNADNEGSARASAAAAGSLGSAPGQSDIAGAEGAGQAAINNIESQFNLQIANIQTQLNVDEYNYSSKQCTSAQSCTAQHGSESFFNTQTNRCECAAGYAPNANNPFSCISMQDFCTDTVGNGAIAATNNYVDGVADSVNCTCGSGYEWNSNQTQCVAIPTVTPPSSNPVQYDATPVAPSVPAQLNPDGTVPSPFGTSTISDPSFHVSALPAMPAPHTSTGEGRTELPTQSLSNASSSAAISKVTFSVVPSSAATSAAATSSAVIPQGFFTAAGNFFGQLFGKLFSFF